MTDGKKVYYIMLTTNVVYRTLETWGVSVKECTTTVANGKECKNVYKVVPMYTINEKSFRPNERTKW